MYHQPFAATFARIFGAQLGEALASVGRAVPKVVVLDCRQHAVGRHRRRGRT